ncbi:hypothetical protein AB4Z17_09420 [Paenibacillus sp. TAF43_2]|uniref:hypothetical protein n=1 Tax=Paenibacillus sp. TAF43_2 TaxID=3233069 RepID=UPI003F97EA9C
MQTTGNLGLKKPEGTDVVDIADLNGNADILDTAVSNKVDKVAGKQLSTEDYTTAEKTKLAGVAAGANAYVHPANHPASVIIQDASNRFVTDAEKTAWNAKATTAVATTSTAGLQSAADKVKLDGIAAGANNYTHPATHPASIIVQDASNRFASDAEKATWNAKASTAFVNNEVGDRAALLTTAKGTTVAAINELFTSASNGKTAIAAAITGMGQAASGSDTHAQLATKISNISKDANAPVGEVITGKTFYQGGVKRTGTLPLRTALNGNAGAPGHHTPFEVTPTVGAVFARPTPITGITAYSGDCWLKLEDAGFNAANIKAGVSMFGVAGTLATGKRIVSGTGTSYQADPFDTWYSYNNTELAMPRFRVTGHGFIVGYAIYWANYKDNVVHMLNVFTRDFQLGAEYNGGPWADTFTSNVSGQSPPNIGTSYYYRAQVSKAYRNDGTQFVIPISDYNRTINYILIEA